MSTCTAPIPGVTPPVTATPLLTPTDTPIPGEKQEATVIEVVDGDTILVDLDGERYRVRYIGVDTPETHHPTDGADYWGFEASEANRSLVREGQTVVMQRDISETDIYGRLLRYVFVEDVLVNAELVRMGLARVLFYEPDILYKHEIMEAEAEAKANDRGVYGPRPTPPAQGPLLYRGTAWTRSPGGTAVALRYDPARGEPIMSLPVPVQIRVVDAFWVPEAQQWWYWIGINGFNGWVTGEFITRESPTDVVPTPVTFDAYEWGTVVEKTTVYGLPGAKGEVIDELDSGISVQVKFLSWDASSDAWWYYVESTQAAGWVASDRLAGE